MLHTKEARRRLSMAGPPEVASTTIAHCVDHMSLREQGIRVRLRSVTEVENADVISRLSA